MKYLQIVINNFSFLLVTLFRRWKEGLFITIKLPFIAFQSDSPEKTKDQFVTNSTLFVTNVGAVFCRRFVHYNLVAVHDILFCPAVALPGKLVVTNVHENVMKSTCSEQKQNADGCRLAATRSRKNVLKQNKTKLEIKKMPLANKCEQHKSNDTKISYLFLTGYNFY